MTRRAPMPPLDQRREQQRVLGHCATQLDILSDTNPAGGFLRLLAGPRTVMVSSPVLGVHSWQLYRQADLDCGLRTLHAQILEEAHALPELLEGREADPEASAPRAVQRRLQRMLALRSLLELSAMWQEAPGPGKIPPGWTAHPMRTIAVLPWHQDTAKVGDGRYLHHLCRWHRLHAGINSWAQETAAWITRAAFLQDVEPEASLIGPLSAELSHRQQQRALPSLPSASIDLDPDAFVRRVRVALSMLLEPALRGFARDEVLMAVQGARSGQVAVSRLLPGVAAGPVQALTERLRSAPRPWEHLRSSEGARSAQAAGSCAVRRSTWTAARAASILPGGCLAAEAAAGPLHLLVPGLPHARPGSPVLCDDRLSSALEEVTDLFAAVAALPAEQALPLPDLSGLLTGRGYLRLGAHAGATFLTEPGPADTGPEETWQHAHALLLFTVPGLTEAVATLKAVHTVREQNLAGVRQEVCEATGLSEAELAEATGGERPFDRTPADQAMERVLHWTGGSWSFLLARHPQELISDGRALSHCVGWGGYAQTVRAGRARIVRVLARSFDDEYPRPLLTLELGQVEDSASDPVWQLVQARGMNNRLPTRDEAALLALWAQEVGVRLTAPGEVPSLKAAARRFVADELAVQWEQVPVLAERPAASTSDMQRAAQQLAEAMAARWTPAATRLHQEGLRRVAELVERARTHLRNECLRLHAEGEEQLVGTLSGDDLLPGTGVLTLLPDRRPTMEALDGGTLEGRSPQLLGLRIDRRLSMTIDADLHAHEQRTTLELRHGKRPGELALHFSNGRQAQVNSYLSPAALMNTGLLDPLHTEMDRPGAWTWGVARRRAGLTLLWSLLDEPLGELETAASAVTRQPGSTLRVQLEAWSGTAAAQRSVARQTVRRTNVERRLARQL